MDALVGTWRPVKGSEKGMEEFLEVVGIPEAAMASFMAREWESTYRKEGEGRLACNVRVTNDPSLQEENLTFALGEEFTFTDVDKQEIKVGYSQHDGSQFTERYVYSKDPNGSHFDVVRKVNGDTMSVTMTANGLSYSQDWKKC